MRLFGTDGIRGTVNDHPMTPETVLRVGMASASLLREKYGRNMILIGKDTRLSGYLIESALTSGICSMGMNVTLVGPIPTPGVAFLTRTLHLDAGIVISASHNPFEDNSLTNLKEGLRNSLKMMSFSRTDRRARNWVRHTGWMMLRDVTSNISNRQSQGG
jgi:phosphomannomutase